MNTCFGSLSLVAANSEWRMNVSFRIISLSRVARRRVRRLVRRLCESRDFRDPELPSPCDYIHIHSQRYNMKKKTLSEPRACIT